MKNLIALFLTIAISVSLFCNSALAAEAQVDVAESTIETATTVCDETTEATTTDEDSNYSIMSTALDMMFTMITSRTDSTRTYSKYYLDYHVTITDVNGNAVDNTVLVTLHAASGSQISSKNIHTNGTTYATLNVPITPGAGYYFTFSAAKNTGVLKVNLYINEHN